MPDNRTISQLEAERFTHIECESGTAPLAAEQRPRTGSDVIVRHSISSDHLVTHCEQIDALVLLPIHEIRLVRGETE